MKLPFTIEQFLEIFRDYNLSVYPAQFILFFLALVAMYCTFRPGSNTDRLISSILSILWLWMGIIYHIIFFTAINKMAYVFGGLFILQSVIFFQYGVIQQKLSFRFQKTLKNITGLFLILFALFLYPFLGNINGHLYPASPTFGLPCPTTIFSFGLLLMCERRPATYLFIIPLLWSLIGFTASFILGMTEDVSLILSAILMVSLNFKRNHEAAGTN
jgi:hypothetical protein